MSYVARHKPTRARRAAGVLGSGLRPVARGACRRLVFRSKRLEGLGPLEDPPPDASPHCPPEGGAMSAVRALMARRRAQAGTLDKTYIEQFFVGLLEGNGTITSNLNSNKSNSILFRIQITLKNNQENFLMLKKLEEFIGGRVLIERKDKNVT